MRSSERKRYYLVDFSGLVNPLVTWRSVGIY
jgi:hypothetical protein